MLFWPAWGLFGCILLLLAMKQSSIKEVNGIFFCQVLFIFLQTVLVYTRNTNSSFFNLYNAVKEILELCPASLLVTLYKIPSFDSVDDFLQKVATVRGKLKKGGIVDVEAAGRIILHDWNEGMHIRSS